MGTKLQTGALHKALGARVIELRKKRGLSQEDLAGLIGVDRSYMGFIERGEKNATLDKIGKLAVSLEVSISELFKGI
jgi:transcriptional regulator with XRE-family HTH domain